MPSHILTCCFLLGLAGLLHSEVPRKPVDSKYRSLWADSPFTTEPVVTQGPVYNPLQDYVLLGVSPIEGGYMVTMLNRNRPADGRLIIESGKPNKLDIRVDKVTRKSGDPMGTRVHIARGSGQTAVVGFEQKFIALKAPPATAQRPQNRVQGRQDPRANQNQNTKPSVRVPRRRIVPPPGVPTPPTPGQKSSGNNRSGR